MAKLKFIEDVEERKKQWKRPRLVADRKKLRQERIKEAGGVARVHNIREQGQG